MHSNNSKTIPVPALDRKKTLAAGTSIPALRKSAKNNWDKLRRRTVPPELSLRVREDKAKLAPADFQGTSLQEEREGKSAQ